VLKQLDPQVLVKLRVRFVDRDQRKKGLNLCDVIFQTGFPYPEISVTDESGCLPVYLLQDQDSSRRPSITLGIGRPPPQTSTEPEISLSM
jgi:hypothetical protein